MRRAAARAGASVLALSPWTLRYNVDANSRSQLRLAMTTDWVIFTSPAAVRSAARLVDLSTPLPGRLLAVGEGSARALRRYGASAVQAPGRMDSEGLLAMIATDLRGARVGLVTAPGGRGMIAAEVQRRGATLVRANVYERLARTLSVQDLRKLQAPLTVPGVLALSSAEALQLIWPQLPKPVTQRWLQQPLVAASARLAELASAYGFAHILQAEGPLPAQLVAAAAEAITCIR